MHIPIAVNSNSRWMLTAVYILFLHTIQL
uniref:Uncharacterized protein n=1 Tax=Anguilla anguilla TaxID=7936 RepID=A0A0E9VAQ5_ANGAN